MIMEPYLSNYLPKLVNTGGYIPSNTSMSFATEQPKLFAALDSTRFDGNMNLVGDNKTFNWNPPVAQQGISFTDKLNAGANVALAGIGAYNAFNANKLGRKQFAFEQDAFNKQYNAQKGLTNSQLADRQDQRVRMYGDQRPVMSTAEYMDKYGVK